MGQAADRASFPSTQSQSAAKAEEQTLPILDPAKSYKDFQTEKNARIDRKDVGSKREEGFLVVSHYPY